MSKTVYTVLSILFQFLLFLLKKSFIFLLTVFNLIFGIFFTAVLEAVVRITLGWIIIFLLFNPGVNPLVLEILTAFFKNIILPGVKYLIKLFSV